MRVVLASRNHGKLDELKPILAPVGLTLESQADHEVSSPEETGTTFIENAIIKARTVSQATDLPALADDSGIVVPALDGAPGIYSARYAGPDANDEDNNAKLVAAISEFEQPVAAYYFCAIVFFKHALDPTPLIATAPWHGHLITSPRGSNGFGYDPYFIPSGFDMTSAELEPTKKNAISHRAIACGALLDELKHQNAG